MRDCGYSIYSITFHKLMTSIALNQPDIDPNIVVSFEATITLSKFAFNAVFFVGQDRC
jgi:hypothetical protein